METSVGRESDLAQLDDCLEDYRLVTLLGIVGTGDTRIALKLAGRQLQKSITQSSNLQSCPSEYPDGIYFFSLDLVTRVADIPIGLAKILGLRIPGNQSLHFSVGKACGWSSRAAARGLPAPSNVTVGRMDTALRRKIATPDEARQLLRLKGSDMTTI